MAKAITLTKQQERMIVAAAAGGATLREIAAAYGVSKDKIAKILRENEHLQTIADNIKKETEEAEYRDILEYFERNKGKLAGRVAKALDVPDEAFDASSPKERCGFAKVVTELVLMMKHEREAEEGATTGGDRLEIVFVDNSKKDAEEDET